MGLQTLQLLLNRLIDKNQRFIDLQSSRVQIFLNAEYQCFLKQDSKKQHQINPGHVKIIIIIKSYKEHFQKSGGKKTLKFIFAKKKRKRNSTKPNFQHVEEKKGGPGTFSSMSF